MLAAEKRHHFIGSHGQKLWTFTRSAQGFRNVSLSWAGPSSLLFRCTQSVFAGLSSQCKHPEARSHFCVDHPPPSRRTANPRDDVVSISVMMWKTLGFPSAFQSAQRGARLVWTGRHIEVKSDRVITTNIIPQKMV